MFIPMNAIHPINPCFSISLTAHDCLTHPDTPFDWITICGVAGAHLYHHDIYQT